MSPGLKPFTKYVMLMVGSTPPSARGSLISVRLTLTSSFSGSFFSKGFQLLGSWKLFEEGSHRYAVRMIALRLKHVNDTVDDAQLILKTLHKRR